MFFNGERPTLNLSIYISQMSFQLICVASYQRFPLKIREFGDINRRRWQWIFIYFGVGYRFKITLFFLFVNKTMQ